MSLEITELIGAEIEQTIPALAGLRISVFRAWPYLYNGSFEYESRYLRTYLECPNSLVVLVRDAGRVVGASSALPMQSETEEFKKPLLEHGFDVSRVMYLAESVLLPEYRNRGFGVEFFNRREAHARRLGGFEWAAFCAVERPEDHPLKPAHYVPLDEFWRRRGYTRHPELRAMYAWPDVGDTVETEKPMTFWLKRLEDHA